jgi:hypothetical protein
MRISILFIFFIVCSIAASGQEIKYSQIKKMAETMHSHRGDRSSELMRLDSVFSKPEDTIVFLMTILKANKNTPAMKDFKNKYEPLAVTYFAKDRKIRDLLLAKIIFVQKFYFENKEYFLSIFITPDKYLKMIQ